MEYRFTASISEALAIMDNVHDGMLPQSTRDSSWWHRVPPPQWSGFRYYNRIKASAIRKTKRVDSPKPDRPGYWELARTVEFYFRNRLVATVELVGIRIDGYDNRGADADNASFWEASFVRYYTVFKSGQSRPIGLAEEEISNSNRQG